MMPTDATAAWIRNASDERAAAAGCRFSASRGAFTVWWIERYCRLYEGHHAGEPLILRGCHQCGTYDLAAGDEWNDETEARAVLRACRYAQCLAAGHAVDWQYECTMRLFGWERWSENWRRWIRRFRKASIWTAKKNKKSPTLAAWGLYLTCGDGEPGNKVYPCAKDGAQVREIVGKHVIEMVRSSPELSAECTINVSLQQVTHEETRSSLRPLSSSNSRTKESKEGLNGSILVDETHVVDADFISRLSRAGISRAEPLQIEVSTAGNNPDGYGRAQFDYALQVIAGEREDLEFFAAVYAAPQKLTQEELAADPLKYGRMANPSMGHTVDPEEFLADYARSKARGLAALLEFLMYRLNIWQATSNPWLRAEDWERCRRAFTPEDLAGRRCYSAIDLSRTRDMTALALLFPPEGDEEGYHVLPYFWLPEDRAAEIDHHMPVLQWAREGHLTLTPGGVIDYGQIVEAFLHLAELFDIAELTYDPKFAEEVTQRMCDGTLDAEGNVLIAGAGIERFPFAQNDANFAAPTDDFERLVIAGLLWHNGHPVLSRQAQHAQVYVRPFTGVKRVRKPAGGDWKTVDGIIASIMAKGRTGSGADEAWYSAGSMRD